MGFDGASHSVMLKISSMLGANSSYISPQLDPNVPFLNKKKS